MMYSIAVKLLHRMQEKVLFFKFSWGHGPGCSTTMSAVDFECWLEGGRGVEIWVMGVVGCFS